MTAHLLAQAAYTGAAVPTRTGGDTEYDVFARVTRQLRTAMRGDGGFNALVRALHDNRALWTALAADVAIETNGLPRPLRAQIFYLAEFTTHHSRRVLEDEADAGILVEINTAVMRGLRQEAGAA